MNRESPFGSRWNPNYVEPVKRFAPQFFCEKLVTLGDYEEAAAEWRRTGLAPCWEAATRHAGAIGGRVRVLDRAEVHQVTFDEGVMTEDFRQW
jgi:hypothetical protein